MNTPHTTTSRNISSGPVRGQLIYLTADDRAHMVRLLRAADDATDAGDHTALEQARADINTLIAPIFEVWRDGDDEMWRAYPYGCPDAAANDEPAGDGITYVEDATSRPIDEVTVTAIEHRQGTSLSAHLSEKSARDEVYEHVAEGWQDEELGPIPDDRDEAIAAYFEDNAEESWISDPVSLTA
ncbi:MAG: hypothetical protein L0H59_07140 [Tomitella sp.]|nr:hypothetical protein [Tomitella sp.]